MWAVGAVWRARCTDFTCPCILLHLVTLHARGEEMCSVGDSHTQLLFVTTAQPQTLKLQRGGERGNMACTGRPQRTGSCGKDFGK